MVKIIYRKAFGVFYEKIIEKKDETIEHLEELLLKRNKMLFDETAEEPTEETIVVKESPKRPVNTAAKISSEKIFQREDRIEAARKQV
ncbi:transposase [Ruminococcus albus SY3]|uniref:Transposase n=1 Tax=Ruminococcus albus SY3 TaxID=1341156 RepID=A0A011VQV6_RUMAL|nr:hypothetical protein [Ruminococcus albus]EXM37636.1 transposase [Ruminococcus albus SY3]